MCLINFLGRLKKKDFVGDRATGDESPAAQTYFLNSIRPLVLSEETTSLGIDALEFAMAELHVMTPLREQLPQTLQSLLMQGIGLAVEYDEYHPDFRMIGEHMDKFSKCWLLHSLMWACVGSSSWDVRRKFGNMLLRTSGEMLPGGEDMCISDYRV
jgi:dynein heavy chain 1